MQNDFDTIKSWFERDVQRTMSDGELLEAYNQRHPSKVFLRSLPRDAVVLDVGAGDGSFSIVKRWPQPARPDLRMYAYSLEEGDHFDQYEGFELGDWNKAPPKFEGITFNAIICAHFIEHIDNPKKFIKWAVSRLSPGGRIYIEWPSENALHCPKHPTLSQVGLPPITANYFDDSTHQGLMPARSMVMRTLERLGLEIETSGIVRMPLLADELLDHYRKNDDTVSLQLGYWLKTGWVQQVTASVQGLDKQGISLASRIKRLLR